MFVITKEAERDEKKLYYEQKLIADFKGEALPKYRSSYVAVVCEIVALFLAILNLVDFVQMACYLRCEMIWRFWSYLDLLSISLNLICSSNLFASPDLIQIRIVEAFLVLVMFLKSLYFMRLIQEIAPLVGIMS